MKQFFAKTNDIHGDSIALSPNDAHHIFSVLRMRSGERVRVVCEDRVYECTLESVSEESVTARIDDMQAASSELPISITLMQGIAKGDRFETVIQKSTELGVASIVPMVTQRTVVKLTDEKVVRKVERWQSIARSAAEQSMRSVIPEVHKPVTFDESLRLASECDAILMPYELAEDIDATRHDLEGLRDQAIRSLAILIGPEGGFSTEEVEAAQKAGARVITLGKRILRTETAPLVILSWLGYIFE